MVDVTIDYRCEDKKNEDDDLRGGVGAVCLIGLDSRSQKIRIITPKIRTVQPKEAIGDDAFKLGFEIVKF